MEVMFVRFLPSKCTLFFFYLSFCTTCKELLCIAQILGMGVMFHLLEVKYPQKLFGILLYRHVPLQVISSIISLISSNS